LRLAGSPLCEGFQFSAIAVEKGEFFGVRPSLELEFAGYGFLFGFVVFLINQSDGAAVGGEEGAAAFVVYADPLFDVSRVTDVKTSVGAAKDVHDKGIC
jgi:hypothetical protein